MAADEGVEHEPVDRQDEAAACRATAGALDETVVSGQVSRADVGIAGGQEPEFEAAEIPVRDVTAIDLPRGGRAERSPTFVQRLTPRTRCGNAATTALLRLRFLVGRLLRWDDERVSRTSDVLVPPELAARSHIPPGTKDGISPCSTPSTERRSGSS